MKFDLFSKSIPAMPATGEGTEVINFILQNASENMRQPLASMMFPALATHVSSEVQFQYASNQWFELCGEMSHLVAHSGAGKGELTSLNAAIMRRAKEHDREQERVYNEWAKNVKSLGANRQKPPRPEVAYYFPTPNMTNPAFIQNAMALEAQGGASQFIDMPEVEMAYKLCGGRGNMKDVILNIFDRGHQGSLRATAEGVTGNPLLRVNFTMSSTEERTRKFYRNEVTSGLMARIAFTYIPRRELSGIIPRQGEYNEEYLAALDEKLHQLQAQRGRFVVEELNGVARELAAELPDIVSVSGNNILEELSHRAIIIAWKKGALLWLLNNQQWTPSIGEFVKYFYYYDLWSKLQIFGDMIEKANEEAHSTGKGGPRNWLSELPETFTEQQLRNLRQKLGASEEGTMRQLSVWKNRKYVTYNPATGIYTKTLNNVV